MFVSDTGFSLGDVTMGACFRLFGQVYLALATSPTSHSFGSFVWKLGFNPRL